MSTAESCATPTAECYVSAFRAISGLTDGHYQILRIHYHAPERTITAKQIAKLVGFASYSVVNAQYGRLARLVGEQIEYNPEPERLGTLVRFEKRHNEWHWIMRHEVAQALEHLGWVEGAGILLPEEIVAVAEPVIEGKVYRVTVSAYERDPDARQRCIAAHGSNCSICGFNFGAVYGDVAAGFIQVHHLRPLSEVGCAHKVDPVADLRPVCPNCHAVLHRRIPAYSIQEAQSFLKQNKCTKCGRGFE
jgi:predicted HNH restriction endonuclease